MLEEIKKEKEQVTIRSHKDIEKEFYETKIFIEGEEKKIQGCYEKIEESNERCNKLRIEHLDSVIDELKKLLICHKGIDKSKETTVEIDLSLLRQIYDYLNRYQVGQPLPKVNVSDVPF